MKALLDLLSATLLRTCDKEEGSLLYSSLL